MKSYGYFWRWMAICFFAAAVVVLVVSVIIYALTKSVFASFLVLGIDVGIFAIVGSVFLIIGTVTDNKLKRLKGIGKVYEAEISEIFMTNHVRMREYRSFYAECIYINESEKKCLVKSKLFLTKYIATMKERLSAKVYVNRENPKDYCVDIWENKKESLNVDYDYR